MYNSYISSAVLTLRTKGSLSFSFNDYSNLLSERFDKNPLPSSLSQCCSRCSCCSCCASSFATYRVPISPSLFYGLRQSTLIQWSPCRRLILGGRNRYYYRVPAYGLDDDCYEVSCSFKKKSGGERIERRRKGRVGHINLRERRRLSSVDDAEAVISLLSEEVTECLGERLQEGSSSKRVELEKRSNYGGECQPQRRKNGRLGLLESDSKSQFELDTDELRREGYRKEESEECRRKRDTEEFRKKEDREDFRRKEEREGKEERKIVPRVKNRRERKAISSFSSYYSLSSTGGSESDKETQNEHVGSLEESSSTYKKELWSEENTFEGQVVEEFKRHGEDGGQGKVLEQGTGTRSAGAVWDLRKKSEKQLTEIDEMQSREESSQLYSRMARTSASDHEKVSNSHKQIDNENEKLTLAVNLEKGTRKQYNQTGDLVTEQPQFRRKYQEITHMEDIQGKNGKSTSQYQRQFNVREENLTADADLVGERMGENCSTVGQSAGNSNIRRNNTAMSEIGNVDTERVSNLQRQYESRMKIHEEDSAVRSVWETNEKCQQTFEQITGQTESRRDSQWLSERSEIQDSTRKMSLQSETGMRNQEVSMDVVYHLAEEAKEQRSPTKGKAIGRIQSRKESQNVTNISVNVTNVSLVHASDIERVNDSQITSKNRIIDQGSELTSVLKPTQQTRERDDQTDERISQIKSRNKAHMTSEISSFQEKTSQEASSSQAFRNMVSQSRMQQIDVEGDYRSSQAIMMPPSPQVVARGSLCVDPTSGIATQEALTETSESSLSAFNNNSGERTPTSQQELYDRDRKGEIYGEPSKLLGPEDALGAAHRQEESSMQFVGEFVQRARHEVLTSEITKQKVSNQNLMYEGEKDKRKSSVQNVSEELLLKEKDSRRSSVGSGVKGPSDEMWDVADPSFQEPSETEDPEGSTATKNTVVKRTGRSLWGIIADIVRLRWGSRAETPKSTRRSGGKGSSNDSVNSEAWFSGHDPEENSDKTVERERSSMAKEVSSSRHLQLMETSSRGQGKESDMIGSKNKIRQLEGDTSSSPTILKSGSTTKGISSPEEENLVWRQDGKSSQGTRSQDGKNSQVFPPSTEVGEASFVPLPSSGMNTLIVEESYGRATTDATISGSTDLMEQPASAKLTEVSSLDGNDGVLKQRRLQRNKQVLRDRFDEWEEAYIRESEQRKVDEMFMREALLEAKKAADTWEVPVGAVLVQNGKIIARGYNLVEELRDSTAHAEMICIREASNHLRSWRLAEATLYVTLEPCPMCAGAILQARIDTLVWGAPNKLLGADGSWIRLFPGGENGSERTDKPAPPVHPFHPKMTIRRGIMASECADVMQQFFQLRRKKKVKSEDLPPQPSLPIASHQSKILSKMHDIFHAFLCL
ncbi:hypothetical protein P3X46_023089 [Hevea brasiliensis]|uniref:tRNA(adenine(34)) deaminase n=1 Tax=Hevea brasiliensis TaxID=3981 RepID=A0ABQ9LBQ3_HEVBR|nr:tRNA(adenine(34)) deaminase, chloroplastic [Hevea brasiliensis]KAJ9163419.1 hypothetical protein P3X46_023089 [Hevea brasiliensis]